MLTYRQQITLVSQEYCRATGVGLGTLSVRLFNRGSTLHQLADGSADAKSGRIDDALEWLAAIWPDNAVWPADVPRPSRVRAGQADTPSDILPPETAHG